MATRPVGSAERTIRFYRVDNGVEESGEPRPFDPAPALRRLQGMLDAGEFYHERRSGSLLTCWIDRDRRPQRVRLIQIRRSDLPEIEEARQLSPLDLAENAGLAEKVHFGLLC